MSEPATTDGATIPGLETDPDGARVVAEELRLLRTIGDALEHARRAAGSAGAQRVEDDARLLELRDDIGTAKPEDLPALFEQMHTLGALRAQRGKSAAGSIDRNAPYFGHLRLEETFPGDPRPRRRDVLVGSRSYVDPTAGVRIVDWRNAPVSRIYYRYREGEDYEELLGGRPVEGVVLARRSVGIVRGELVRVAAPEGTFVRGEGGVWRRVDAVEARLVVTRRPGDPARSGATGNGAADRGTLKEKLLPAIASMLDPAQFELITRPGTGVVAIQGSAGSGKTTVGLHRVAYLAASEPSRFKPERMLVVVPTEALIHYTARVLPELGVPGVRVTTFSRWAVRVVADLFPRLSSRISEDTPPAVIRAKSHARMLGAIDRLARRVDRDTETALAAQMGRWDGGRGVIDAWRATGGPPDVRLTMVAQWIAGKRPIRGVEAAMLPEATRQAAIQLGTELRKVTRDVLGAWDELTTSRPLLEETFAGEAGLGVGQLDQVHAWGALQSRIRSEGERDGETPSIDEEDFPLLLRLYQALRGPLVDIDAVPLRIAHLFVDEVQDASPVALAVLMDLTGKDRSITFAGDTAQRMLEDEDTRGEFDWHGLFRALNLEHPGERELEPLRVSYRSTREITTFARGLLGPLAHEAEPIATHSGPPVELFACASPGEAVAILADALKDLARVAPDANVAVLARFGPQADVYHDGLARAEVPNVRRVRKQDFTWAPGVEVTEVRQTKGLEWDEVVLVDANLASYPDSPQARHAAYVGATRAAHQLWCFASDAPSAIFTAALPVRGS